MVELILKDHSGESRLFTQRIVIAGVLVLVAMLIVIAKLVQLQIGNYAHLSTLSHYNQVRLEPLPPTRGLIYDANGILLADNYSSLSLEIIPEEIQNLDVTIAEIGRLINRETDLKRFARIRKQRRRFEEIPIYTNLTQKEVARFVVKGHRFPGVAVRARLLRTYPLGEYTAHVLGYVGRINGQELKRINASNYAGTNHIGKGGVEQAHEDLLHGTVGYRQVGVNVEGRVLRVLEQYLPKAGQHLQLYLDSRLQQDAYAALSDHRGAVVAIDPRTGGVLALVSRPSFDPNLFVNGISSADYKTLRDSLDKPLFNRAVCGQYPPGSTIKPFIGFGGLETGTGSLTGAKWCPGYYRLPGHSRRYRCWNRWGHGAVTLQKAIIQSCDVYFYKLAYVMGIDRLHDFLAEFGFGARTGIDVAGELGGLLPSREWKMSTRSQPWFIGETLLVGIGQGPFLATPLQLAVATSAVAARGRFIRPRVVRATGAPGSAAEREFPAQVRQLPVSSHHFDDMIASMVKVVRNKRGTARRIRTNAYDIAGKTGTVQVFNIKQEERYRESEVAKHMRDHALFVAFAPVEDPRIAVAVLVENGGHGGAVAAPIARRVMDSYLLRMPSLTAAGEFVDEQ